MSADSCHLAATCDNSRPCCDIFEAKGLTIRTLDTTELARVQCLWGRTCNCCVPASLCLLSHKGSVPLSACLSVRPFIHLSRDCYEQKVTESSNMLRIFRDQYVKDQDNELLSVAFTIFLSFYFTCSHWSRFLSIIIHEMYFSGLLLLLYLFLVLFVFVTFN